MNAVTFCLGGGPLQRETKDRDARQKLGCSRRSRAAVGNVGTGCTFWYLLHMAEVCPCVQLSLCSSCLQSCPVVGCSALSLVLLLMCVMWSGRRARSCCPSLPVPQQAQSLAEIVGGRIHLQESMREHLAARTQNPAHGGQEEDRVPNSSFITTKLPLNCRWTRRRAQRAQITGAQPHLLPDQTWNKIQRPEERTAFLSFPLSVSRLGTSDRRSIGD